MNPLILSLVLLMAANTWAVTAPQTIAPGDELPEGEGKKILQMSCTSCHDLGEVTKFRGYYTREQWRDIVVTMMEYGAELRPSEIETLADYLEQHLGRRNEAAKGMSTDCCSVASSP